MVVGVIASLAGLLKANISKARVDNTVFRLHYKWTTSFCYLTAALVAASDLIGSPIKCQGADKATTTFCWITSTFTINTTYKEHDYTYYGSYGSDFYGIGTYDPDVHEKTFHAYYQWVPFFLFFQGCLFYLPHQIWKMIEGKQLDNLLQGLRTYTIIDESLETKKRNIIKYLRYTWGLNKKYFAGYVFCEILNLANVIGQMFLLDAFFGGMFLNYGSKVLQIPSQDDSRRFDPLIETFPRVTKCTFHKYGPSGTLQNFDYICILPQNILNEKIFLVMWIWFIVLATITSAQLVFRFLMCQFSIMRLKLLENKGKLEHSIDLQPLVRHMHLGDFFLVHSIGKNVSAMCFKDILNGIKDIPMSHLKALPSAPPSKDVKSALYDQELLDDMRENTLYSKENFGDEDTLVKKINQKMLEDSV